MVVQAGLSVLSVCVGPDFCFKGTPFPSVSLIGHLHAWDVRLKAFPMVTGECGVITRSKILDV